MQSLHRLTCRCRLAALPRKRERRAHLWWSFACRPLKARVTSSARTHGVLWIQVCAILLGHMLHAAAHLRRASIVLDLRHFHPDLHAALVCWGLSMTVPAMAVVCHIQPSRHEKDQCHVSSSTRVSHAQSSNMLIPSWTKMKTLPWSKACLVSLRSKVFHGLNLGLIVVLSAEDHVLRDLAVVHKPIAPEPHQLHKQAKWSYIDHRGVVYATNGWWIV